MEEVRALTGYDRVMMYKFHDDEHGEVVAESVREDMEPLLGLHYPATDIPQAARALFVLNRVRMIADASADNVPVIQSAGFPPFDLARSTLRGALQCHREYMTNMGTAASLVMAVVINEAHNKGPASDKERKLWGLCVCHHATPRSAPAPPAAALPAWE